MKKKKEIEEYRIFTKPAELHKAINTLRGLVAGITSDVSVESSEMMELVHWCELHGHLRDRHPFSEILPVVEQAYADGVITDDESKDILWLCNNFADNSSYYDEITSSIQFLSGLVHGIMADGILSDREINILKSWIDANSFLSGSYPFDEINALLHSILEDKKISEEERGQLSAFLGNIIEFKNSYNLSESTFDELRKKYSIEGICSLAPDIKIRGKFLCFTGKSYRGTRNEIEDIIRILGGTPQSNVSKTTNYVIVGNSGNPCWAYACYGRKIEGAMNLRKEGHRITIVNETDFWAVVEEEMARMELV